MSRKRAHLVLIAVSLGASQLAARADGTADRLLTNDVIHPGLRPGTILNSNSFADLHTEALVGRLKACWTNAPTAAAETLVVYASAGPEDHWPARDWRLLPLERSGQQWQAELPVDDLDVPVVYYAVAAQRAATNVSPLRVVWPRQAGLEEPTRLFWPFLEGFEETLDSWQLLEPSPVTPPLSVSSTTKNGRAALRLTLPAGRPSVRVATTRVRGWQLLHEGATGLRVWLRTEVGRAHVRCSLRSRAFTPDESTSVWPGEIPVEDTWKRVDLPFNSLSSVRWRGVDLFVLEFFAEQPASLLIDDLQFLGPWRFELE